MKFSVKISEEEGCCRGAAGVMERMRDATGKFCGGRGVWGKHSWAYAGIQEGKEAVGP